VSIGLEECSYGCGCAHDCWDAGRTSIWGACLGFRPCALEEDGIAAQEIFRWSPSVRSIYGVHVPVQDLVVPCARNEGQNLPGQLAVGRRLSAQIVIDQNVECGLASKVVENIACEYIS
jgi:hypothetical protein